VAVDPQHARQCADHGAGRRDRPVDHEQLDNLPPGKYLVSVTADGYKIDGSHFTVASGQTTAVEATMQPYPLPLGTVRIQVFNDNIPVDGTYEVDAEQGLAGFHAVLSDVLGLVSTDYYGNPLCTRYQHSARTPRTPNGRVVFADGKPVISGQSTGCVKRRERRHRHPQPRP